MGQTPQPLEISIDDVTLRAHGIPSSEPLEAPIDWSPVLTRLALDSTMADALLARPASPRYPMRQHGRLSGRAGSSA